MDPDEALAEIRRLNVRIDTRNEKMTRGQLSDLIDEYAEAVQALDNWIENGGFLPQSWAKAAAVTAGEVTHWPEGAPVNHSTPKEQQTPEDVVEERAVRAARAMLREDPGASDQAAELLQQTFETTNVTRRFPANLETKGEGGDHDGPQR